MSNKTPDKKRCLNDPNSETTIKEDRILYLVFIFLTVLMFFIINKYSDKFIFKINKITYIPYLFVCFYSIVTLVDFSNKIFSPCKDNLTSNLAEMDQCKQTYRIHTFINTIFIFLISFIFKKTMKPKFYEILSLSLYFLKVLFFSDIIFLPCKKKI